MKYEDLKKEIKAIADIASSVPEVFREKCFELLLDNLLKCESSAAERQEPPVVQKSQQPKHSHSKLPTPAQIKVLMSKTGVTQEELGSVVLIEDEELHFIREPSTTTVSEGQIQWALLVALKNALLNNSLSVDPEDVRSICQEKGFYDQANFATNFKTAKYAKLFRKPLEPQGEAQSLTSDGQVELGKLIKGLAQASE